MFWRYLFFPHNKKTVFTAFIVRAPGIEPESHPWQGRVLPLNHARNREYYTRKRKITKLPECIKNKKIPAVQDSW